MPLNSFSTLSDFIDFELWMLLGGLAAVVGYQLLTGRINTRGLLNDKRTKLIDPGRVQLLAATLVAAAAYLGDRDAFADPSVQTAAGGLLGASNVFYLIQKFRSMSAK
jgi:hypothetical protein